MYNRIHRLDFFFRRLLCLAAVLLAASAASLSAQNSISGLFLVDADTGTVLQPLVDGAVLDLSALPTANLKVRASVVSEEAETESVAFVLSGFTSLIAFKNEPPYTIEPSAAGDYSGASFYPGAHTLTVRGYTEDFQRGDAGDPVTVAFTVVEQTPGPELSVELTAPSGSYALAAPASLSLEASASDSDGQVTQVEFFAGTNRLGVDTQAPYTLDWLSVPAGVHELTAVATDDAGNTATSDPITVDVVTPQGGGQVHGELRQWHRVSITFDGPATSEVAEPNPFTDYRLEVSFVGPSGQVYRVPGFYAADGDAANTGAESGNQWRVHFAPDEAGDWTYLAAFRTGADVATGGLTDGTPIDFHGAAGTFSVAASNKTGRDFRAKGRLEYVGGHYPRFAGNGEYFLKQGPDAPENFLAYADFDGPFKTDGNYNTGTFGSESESIKTWSAHLGDWNSGDPSWSQVDGVSGTHGRAMLGALNYLAAEGLNAFSFLTFNIQGDDRNVFMYRDYEERERIDVSRMAQWEVVFAHADSKGLFLHFKTQERENDKLLDGGNLGPLRKLYYRELIARFSHHLALNWNLGEENLQSTAQQQDLAAYIREVDPYDHLIVMHTFPDQQDTIYTPLLAGGSELTGVSLQTKDPNFALVHREVLKWVRNSAAAGKPWAVAADEPGDAIAAIRPDSDPGSSHVNGRKYALWGTLLAGGWGNEWYFGYGYPQSDLTCEDYRSRDAWWDYCRHALEFFKIADVPYWEMVNDNALSGATDSYCFYKRGSAYIVYLDDGGSTDLNLGSDAGEFAVYWFDPRNGGAMQTGTVTQVSGGATVNLGEPPSDPNQDWVILVRNEATATSDYLSWQSRQDWGGVPVSKRGPLDDPDGDGMKNQFERAFGTNPAAADPFAYPLSNIGVDSSGDLTIAFTFPRSGEDTVETIHWSPDMLQWFTATGVTESLDPESGLYTMEATIDGSTLGRVFYRMFVDG